MCLPFSDRRLNTHACIRPRTHARARSRDASRARPRHCCCVALLFRRVAVSILRCYVTYDQESTRPHIASRLFFFSPVHTRVHRLPIGVKIVVPLAKTVSRISIHARHACTRQSAKFHATSPFFRPVSARSRFRRATAYSRFSSFDK